MSAGFVSVFWSFEVRGGKMDLALDALALGQYDEALEIARCCVDEVEEERKEDVAAGICIEVQCLYELGRREDAVRLARKVYKLVEFSFDLFLALYVLEMGESWFLRGVPLGEDCEFTLIRFCLPYHSFLFFFSLLLRAV